MKIHIGRDVQTTRTGDIFHITGFLSGYKFLPLESRKCNSFFEMTNKDNSWQFFGLWYSKFRKNIHHAS